jgi:hypothetical protein
MQRQWAGRGAKFWRGKILARVACRAILKEQLQKDQYG